MKKKICLIVPSLKAGGMERVMSEVANYLGNDKDLEIHLILFTREDSFFDVSERVTIHEPSSKR